MDGVAQTGVPHRPLNWETQDREDSPASADRTRLTLARRVSARCRFSVFVSPWRAVDFQYRLTWSDTAFFVGRTDINADGILFGAIFALALRDERFGPFARWIVGHRLTARSAIGLFALTFVVQPNPAIGLALLTVRAITVPIMILATVNQPHGLLARALEAPPMRFLGLISYSLYLWRQLFLSWEPSASLSAVQWFPFNVVAAVFCAVISFALVESPMIRFGRRERPPTAGLRSLPA